MREAWTLDWEALRTPLGLPGQCQAVCTRTSFIPLREGLAPRAAEHHFYATSLPAWRAGLARLRRLVRGHWAIENRLHHVKDRTWLEDRHWVGSPRTGALVTMLRSLACGLLQTARLPGLSPKAHCPERIEHLNRHPRRALKLVTGRTRL